jgi:alkaline phosphatase D
MWDNHEFSWHGYQGLQVFDGKTRPAQTLKVAANQAFFEYQPARMIKASGPSLEAFAPPKVEDVPVKIFDDNGLGQERNNLTAINSLKGYRKLGWGANVDLFITDERSYRSEDPGGRPEADKLGDENFPDFIPEEVLQILDGGRAYKTRNPPDVIRWGSVEIPNVRKHESPQTLLGAEQKTWFLDQLRRSNATWKIWGSTTGTLEMRADPQNLPPGFYKPWSGNGYASFGGGDMSCAYAEKAEIYEFIREHGITGFATVAGDRHSFWAGLAAKELPPSAFDPVGVAFIVGSISSPGMLEALENKKKKDDPLRSLFLGQAPTDERMQPTVNMLMRHGVRSCLEYVKTGNVSKARRLSNPQLSPHVSFVDMGGHGYAVVRASREQIEAEFVCIPRPIKRSEQENGGPLRYRAIHTAKLWAKGKAPVLQTRVAEGNADFSI